MPRTVLSLALVAVTFGLGVAANAQDTESVLQGAANGNVLQQLFKSLLEFSDNAGAAGVAVFIGVYAVACVFLVPASLLTLGAGALYGPALGTAVVSAASTLGCTLAFLVSRYVARPFAEKRLLSNERFSAIDSGIAQKGGYIVFLLRLSPLVPFGILNYMIGLTKVELTPYVLASWAGMLPGTFAYVYLGSVGKEAAGGGDMSPAKLALYGVGAVATILATREIAKVASRELSNVVDEPEGASEPLNAGTSEEGRHRE